MINDYKQSPDYKQSDFHKQNLIQIHLCYNVIM